MVTVPEARFPLACGVDMRWRSQPIGLDAVSQRELVMGAAAGEVPLGAQLVQPLEEAVPVEAKRDQRCVLRQSAAIISSIA